MNTEIAIQLPRDTDNLGRFGHWLTDMRPCPQGILVLKSGEVFVAICAWFVPRGTKVVSNILSKPCSRWETSRIQDASWVEPICYFWLIWCFPLAGFWGASKVSAVLGGLSLTTLYGSKVGIRCIFRAGHFTKRPKKSISIVLIHWTTFEPQLLLFEDFVIHSLLHFCNRFQITCQAWMLDVLYLTWFI